MHTKAFTLLTSFLAAGLLSSVASAQTEPAPAPAPAPTEAQPAPAPGAAQPAAPAEATAEPAPTAPAEPMPAAPPTETAQVDETMPPPEAMPPAAPAAPAEAPPAEGEEGGDPDGWFRIDSDGLGLQFWVGATHHIGGFDLATDIYLDVGPSTPGTFAEFDIGPQLTLSDEVTLIPMAGIGFDWSVLQATTLIAPQLFTYLNFNPVYFESWIQAFLNSPFIDQGDNNLYFRNFLLFSLIPDWSIGPHVEFTLALNNDRDTLASMQVGGATSLNYGANNQLLLFLGAETQDAAQGPDGEMLVGRFTFVRTW